MTVDEAADVLQIRRTSGWRLVQRDELPVVHLGTDVFVGTGF
jgi:hypothetical protein